MYEEKPRIPNVFENNFKIFKKKYAPPGEYLFNHNP